MTAPETDGLDDASGSRLEVYGSSGRYWFRLVSKDGELLLLSNNYASRDNARRDIERLRDKASSFRPCMTADGDFYFQVTAADGEFLATSTMYALPSERDDAQAIASRLVRAEFPALRVVLL